MEGVTFKNVYFYGALAAATSVSLRIAGDRLSGKNTDVVSEVTFLSSATLFWPIFIPIDLGAFVCSLITKEIWEVKMNPYIVLQEKRNGFYD